MSFTLICILFSLKSINSALKVLLLMPRECCCKTKIKQEKPDVVIRELEEKPTVKGKSKTEEHKKKISETQKRNAEKRKRDAIRAPKDPIEMIQDLMKK